MKAANAEPEIVTRNGKPVSVILPIRKYQEMIECLEDAKDVAWLKRARRRKLHFRPLEALSVLNRRDCPSRVTPRQSRRIVPIITAVSIFNPARSSSP